MQIRKEKDLSAKLGESKKLTDRSIREKGEKKRRKRRKKRKRRRKRGNRMRKDNKE